MDRGFEEGAIPETLVNQNLPLHPRVFCVRQIGPAGRLPAEFGEAEKPLNAGQGEMMVCRHLYIVACGLRGVNRVFERGNLADDQYHVSDAMLAFIAFSENVSVNETIKVPKAASRLHRPTGATDGALLISRTPQKYPGRVFL